jgi:hypothetical protein
MKRKISDPDYIPMASLHISSFSGMEFNPNNYVPFYTSIVKDVEE